MKNYLIIGSSSGIGASVSSLLEDSGADVYGTYFTNEPVQNDPNNGLRFLDVTKETMDLDFVPDTLDGLVYCPGSINLRPFSRLKREEFLSDFELQVGGAISVIQSVLPNLRKSAQASIIFFSTVAVQNGFSFHSQVSTSKGAIEGLTRALAAEFAPDIRVNCIAPSLTDTKLANRLLNSEDKRTANAERHPLKRIGAPEDIGEAAAFLLSDKASWITGQVIHVDGGMSSLNT